MFKMFLSYFYTICEKKREQVIKAIIRVLPYSILVQLNLLSIHCIYCKQIIDVP